ncbi:hypothetical protein ACEZCY_36330 [Streptacidiphilus sp. N1-12]|uniref:Neocarzinostatin family protein n=2 Tax=Streptacidiphilus alkalitolerans TaxID=3342712 RepID=A0ABV6VLP3_9ACTN
MRRLTPRRLLVLALLLLTLPVAPARADGRGTVAVAPGTAAPGATTTVTGSGWPAGTLLTVLLCGQNAVSGTDSCANTAERAVTTAPNGTFTVKLPVVAPPKPCPCVIRTTSVTGADLTVDTPFPVLGVAEVPIVPTPAKLLALTAELDGGNGPMNWFGAPAHRVLRVLVANLGSTAVQNPVFRLGVWHSVFAPGWQDYQWTGTIAPGVRQEIDVPVDLPFAAHGGYSIELAYAGRQLATRQAELPRPWGVALFWALLYVVVPVGLFRTGLYLLDRRRPRAVPAEPGPPTLDLPWFAPGTVLLPVHPTSSKGT